MSELYTTEHFDRRTDREVITEHPTWKAACDFARRMSDEHDGSASAHRYRTPAASALAGIGPAWEPAAEVDYVFGELVVDTTPESAGG